MTTFTPVFSKPGPNWKTIYKLYPELEYTVFKLKNQIPGSAWNYTNQKKATCMYRNALYIEINNIHMLYPLLQSVNCKKNLLLNFFFSWSLDGINLICYLGKFQGRKKIHSPAALQAKAQKKSGLAALLRGYKLLYMHACKLNISKSFSLSLINRRKRPCLLTI